MRVLLVDDHMDTRAICAAIISNLGHSVEAVPTIAAALAATSRETFDLLICDIMLPDGIGYDLMRDLSARFGMRGIALTACHTAQDRARSRDAGFEAHLAKPFDIVALEKAMSQLAMPEASAVA